MTTNLSKVVFLSLTFVRQQRTGLQQSQKQIIEKVIVLCPAILRAGYCRMLLIWRIAAVGSQQRHSVDTQFPHSRFYSNPYCWLLPQLSNCFIILIIMSSKETEYLSSTQKTPQLHLSCKEQEATLSDVEIF